MPLGDLSPLWIVICAVYPLEIHHLLWTDTSVALLEIFTFRGRILAMGVITFYSTACCCCGSHHLLQPVVAVGVITFYSMLWLWESSPSITCYCCGSHVSRLPDPPTQDQWGSQPVTLLIRGKGRQGGGGAASQEGGGGGGAAPGQKRSQC